MLEKLDKDLILPTYARNYVNFVEGTNATLKDSEGKSYIDFSAGIGVVSVGHANPLVNRAICEQIGRITHISNLYLIEPQARLAQKLVAHSGYDMQLFFSNSGAEANEGALKIARKYGEINGALKRYKVITLEHSFHGRTISTTKASGQEKMHHYFGPFPDGFVYVSELDAIKEAIDEHTVAVMIELVQGEGGVEPQDKERVQALAKMLKQKDILLIIDEVQTGIYRTGEILASKIYEIEPDIITLAKGLGGGVPIGAVMTNKKGILQVGDHGSTYGGNFLVTAAANAVLDILEEEKNSGKLDAIMIAFENRVEKLAAAYPDFVKEAVGLGLMRGLRMKDAETLTKIVDASFDEGLLVLKAGRNTLRFLPPLTISKKELDDGFEKLNRVFAAL